MIQIRCRHCNTPIGSAGFKGHLQAAHGHTDYDAEIKAHGMTRQGGRLKAVGPANAIVQDLSSVPVPVPVKRKYQRQPKDVGPRTLTISEEAMAIALTGLERIQADLSRHVEEVRASLNAPIRKTGKSYPAEVSLQPIYEAPVKPHVHDVANGPPKLLWSGGRHWSNDPENLYGHHTDGTLRLDAQGQPVLKNVRRSASGRPTPNALRLRKMRERRKQLQAQTPNDKGAAVQ